MPAYVMLRFLLLARTSNSYVRHQMQLKLTTYCGSDIDLPLDGSFCSMNLSLPSPAIPALVIAAGDRAGVRFLEFFASAIHNPHTRRAYARAAADFLT
jgi:hypothetical protein